MRVYRDISSTDIVNGVLTIGTFDGVHRGHQEVIKQLNEVASLNGGESVILTFDTHPRTVVEREGSVKLLSSIEEKINLLESYGVDNLIILNFTQQLSNLSYREFIDTILIDKLNMSSLLMGYDHSFGKGREGTFSRIQRYGKEIGFNCVKLSVIEEGNREISSSRIREAIADGLCRDANIYLGYNYMISGSVVKGKQLGRTIGFPTANVEVLDRAKIIPKIGVYLVTLKEGESLHRGIANIGYRPTVAEDGECFRTIEIHIIDFDRDIYGESVEISFVSRVRDEMKFSSVEALRLQLERDLKFALTFEGEW